MSPTGIFEEFMGRLPLVAILRGLRPEQAEEIGSALVEAEFGLIEVPLNSPEPFESIRRLAQRFEGRALIGAGTVLDPGDVERVMAAGGKLVVMPHGDTSVIEASLRHDLICVPGVATPTEALNAYRLGIGTLKMFPAEALPPVVVKAWRSVLPEDARLMPVGGIQPQRIEAYVEAGADGFGLGSALFKPGMSAQTVHANAVNFAEEWRRCGASSSA